MEAFNQLLESIKKAKNVVILSHVGPDGDTLGSMLAMNEILKNYNNIEKIDYIISGRIPDVYKFLPGIESAKTVNNSELYSSYDLAIAVDCASVERLGDSIDLFRNAKSTANLDHHISSINFADVNIINSIASATGQIVYDLIKFLNINITKNMATYLYTAILTDTGGFKFENTKPETLEICADLMRYGANAVNIYQECLELKPLAMVRLQANVIDNAIFTFDNKIAYTSVTRKLLEFFNASDDHVDGISKSLREINTVEVAIVFKETSKGDTKISFRSKKVDVCEISKFFGGGGHKLAAGCTIQKNIADTINEVLPIVKKQISRLS
jgi:phosphoesterase RecJ-like protein